MGAKPHDSSHFQQEHLAYAEIAIKEALLISMCAGFREACVMIKSRERATVTLREKKKKKKKKKEAINDKGKHELKSKVWSEACADRPALLFPATARPVTLLEEQLHQHQ